MENLFIKENGEIKEVVLKSVKFDYNNENGLTIASCCVEHNGELLVERKGKLYTDKECQNEVNNRDLLLSLKIGSGWYYANGGEPKTLCTKIDGGMEKVNVFPYAINYNKGDKNDCLFKEVNGDKVFKDEKLYEHEFDYKWFEETIIQHNDGTTEVIKAEKEKWEFTAEENELFGVIVNAYNELHKRGVNIHYDEGNAEIYALRTRIEGYDFAFGSTDDSCKNEVEDWDEWNEISCRAYKCILALDTHYSGDAYRYREHKED